MPTFILIETATEVCSSALSVDNEIIIFKQNREQQSHATSLGVFVEDMMQYARDKKNNIDAVAVSCGPGSYTGLRIGVSQAKGLSYGLGIPLIAIPTPKIMASILKNQVEKETILCPMIDARRMEVYATFFDSELNIIRKTAADIITEDSYADILENNKVAFFGNGAEKIKKTLDHENAIFIDGVKSLASSMMELALEAYNNKMFVDSAYFEPFYLKEFVATVPKNKVINLN